MYLYSFFRIHPSSHKQYTPSVRILWADFDWARILTLFESLSIREVSFLPLQLVKKKGIFVIKRKSKGISSYSILGMVKIVLGFNMDQ